MAHRTGNIHNSCMRFENREKNIAISIRIEEIRSHYGRSLASKRTDFFKIANACVVNQNIQTAVSGF